MDPVDTQWIILKTHWRGGVKYVRITENRVSSVYTLKSRFVFVGLQLCLGCHFPWLTNIQTLPGPRSCWGPWCGTVCVTKQRKVVFIEFVRVLWEKVVWCKRVFGSISHIFSSSSSLFSTSSLRIGPFPKYESWYLKLAKSHSNDKTFNFRKVFFSFCV